MLNHFTYYAYGSTGNPPIMCNWDEPFNQANLAAFKTEYNQGNGTGAFWSYPSTGTPDNYFIASGGLLQLLAVPTGSNYEIEFSRIPPNSPAATDGWFKIEGQMLHGDYSSDQGKGAVGLYMADDPAFSSQIYVGNRMVPFSGGGVEISGKEYHFAQPMSIVAPTSGSYAMVVCVSHSGSDLYLEMWNNPTSGSVPDAATMHPNNTASYTLVTAAVDSPITSGSTLTVDRVRWICSTRASDPFGIFPPPLAPVSACGWDEGFDDADYTTFYNRTHYFGYSSLPSPGAVGISVSGSALRIASASSLFPTISPVFFQRQSELWMRVQYRIEGSAFTGTRSPVQLQVFNDNDNSNMAVFGDSNTNLHSSNWEIVVGATYFDSSSPFQQPTGSYSIVMCASNPSPNVLQGEWWLNPIAGATPIGTGSVAKIVGEAFTTAELVLNPGVTGNVLIDRVQLTCGSRSSDPFGVL